MRLFRRLWLAVLLTPLAAAADPCVAGGFPGYSWPSREKQVAVTKAAQIAALEAYAFPAAEPNRKGVRTDGLVIIKGGELIYEKYARGWDETKPHISWSVAKSVTALLTGVAVHQRLLQLDTSICRTLVSQREEVCRLTVRNLLEFASGLDWREDYEDKPRKVSSPIAMLFGEGHRDMLSFITGHRFYAEPGKGWRYSTGDATALAAVAKRALSTRYGKEWAWAALFDVLGMRGVTLEEDLTGTPLGGSHFFATPKDYARLGYLMLRDGCWNGTRVLPEGWVKSSTEPSGPYVSAAPATAQLPNGWMWWLNRVAGPSKEKPWPDAPADAYSADGHWGQFIVVAPSADVVIVRTGDDHEGGLSLARLIPLALEVAK